MEKNIMLAFVSPVNVRSLNEPIIYPEIQGKAYTAIQTNESAVAYVERMLRPKNSLSKIFLIASDSVRRQKVPLENEFGDVTHLEFLQRRIAKAFPELVGKFSVQNYSEEGEGSTKLEKNILQIARISDAVTEFANEHCAEEVVVHADMTGGFRHTSMFMLSIIQLLRYRGIKIGEVLYSEPQSREIYRVTEIQRMFSLIAGADEFVKFGSVEALREYFGANPPAAVKKLLEAMNHFSEAIKICRTSAIEHELQNLGQHIKTFREYPDKDLKSELFAKIIDTIEREYGSLIGGTATRPDIIRWCMRKGFWQQAMTLCTEWLPEEIVARGICLPKDEVVIKNAGREGRSFGRNWQQQLVIAYQGAETVTAGDDDVRRFCKRLRTVLNDYSPKKIEDFGHFDKLNKFFAEYGKGEIPFRLCKGGRIRIADFKKKFPHLFAALQAIYDERKKDLNYQKNFSHYLQMMYYDKIPQVLLSLPNERLLELFNIDRSKIAADESESVEKAETKWENREKVYRELFAKKIIRSSFDEQTALKFLHDYYNIRRERNQVNHANAQASKTIADLKPLIENYLDALEKISSPKKTAATLSRNG